jgi:hypothetical protein
MVALIRHWNSFFRLMLILNFLVQQQSGNKNTQEEKQWIPTVLLYFFNIRMVIFEGASKSVFYSVWCRKLQELHSVDTSKCSTGLCSVVKSRTSTGFCCPDKSRCSSGPCGVDMSRCSRNLRSVDMFRCSSSPCGVELSRYTTVVKEKIGKNKVKCVSLSICTIQ